MVALLVLPFGCFVAICVLCLFHTVPCVGLQCVIVVFPCHTHWLFVSMMASLGLRSAFFVICSL